MEIKAMQLFVHDNVSEAIFLMIKTWKFINLKDESTMKLVNVIPIMIF